MHPARGIVFIILLSLPAQPAFTQTTATAIPSADTFVTSAQPSANFGAAGALSIAAPGLPKGEFRSFMRFDTSSLKTTFDTTYGVGNWTIQSVTLRCTTSQPNNVLFNGNAAGPGGSNVNTAGLLSISWISDDAWIEGNGTTGGGNTVAGAATFSSPPNASGAESLGSFNFNGATSGAITYPLGPSPGLSSDLIGGSNLSLQLLAADSAIAYVFFARAGSNPPVLSVTAIPEPAMLGAVFSLIPFLRRAMPRKK